MTKVFNISKERDQCIKEIRRDQLYQVRILKGAPEALVSCRELRNKYETNREIKIWSVFFLLKALTTAPFIEDWKKQRSLLLTWCQMGERTFYFYLDQLKKRKLITIDQCFNIHLTSWEQAAHLLNIVYLGTHSIQYNPEKYEGKQVFQHFLRAEEILSNQTNQHIGLMSKLDKNPTLRDDLMTMMLQLGADRQRLFTDKVYLRERLLQLQLHLFKRGSELCDYSWQARADINRCARTIQEHHHYKAAQSVSYMKRRMFKHGVITVKKVRVISEGRARLYIPDPTKENGFKEGYKWFEDQKQTALILCDQISINYEKAKDEKRRAVVAKAA